jgi:hypothetical protein
MGLKAVTSGQANITSGTVLVDAGSATAPPVGFAADSDGTGTGLYRFGADSPAITCNGTGAWRWGSTGTYLPITDNAVDVGTSSIRPRDVFIARTLQVGQAVAVTAGGATTGFVGISSTANLGVFCGSGAPTISAAKGSLYLRTDGSTTNDRAYINTSGSTTWTALTTAA